MKYIKSDYHIFKNKHSRDRSFSYIVSHEYENDVEYVASMKTFTTALECRIAAEFEIDHQRKEQSL